MSDVAKRMKPLILAELGELGIKASLGLLIP
jgi:hypothetical protein